MKSEKCGKENKLRSCQKRLSEIFLDIICPKRCIICNCFVTIGKYESVCEDCMKNLKNLSAVIIEPDSFFEEAIGVVPYESHARRNMVQFKFRSMKYLGDAFGHCMYDLICDRDFLNEDFVICPVPIHPLRNREYNQSAVIGAFLSKKLGISIYEDMLIKIKNLSPLSKMGYALRRVSVSGAFEFNLKYDIFGKNILLIDDIYTSGSTANECARVLRMHGASKVIVLAACHNEQKGEIDNGYADYIGN